MRHRSIGLPSRSGLALALLAGAPLAHGQAGGGESRLEEVVVTSSLIETPRRQLGTAVSVIDGAEMQLRGYHSLADTLRTQPGVGVTNSGGQGKATALRIRGEEGFRTLLMIDGVKAVDASAPQGGPSFESLLVTSDVDRVEVLRGPQGFIYGADAGGVVSIITRRGEGDLGGRASLEYGGFGTRRLDASAAGGGDRGDYFVALTDFTTDGFNSQTADTVLADRDGDDNTTLHTKLGWNATERLRVQLVARDIDAETEYDGCFSAATFATVHACVGTTAQTTYKVSADHEGRAVRSSIGYSRVRVERQDFAEDSSAFSTDGELGRLEYTGSYKPTAATTLVFGVDLQNERVAGQDETLERDQRGYYAEYQGSFGERFHLSAGARRDDNDDFGSHTSSRVSGAYVQPLAGGRSLKYRASFGSGFRAPSLYEVSFNRGPFAFPPAAGTALAEETSRGYDLGVEFDGASGLQVDVTYFDQRIEDEIFFDLVGFSGYLQSPGESSSEGIELALRVPVGARWELYGNWTRNDAADTANEQRVRRPRQLGNAGVLYVAASEKLRFAANYRLAKDAIDVGAVVLDDYEVLDLSMAYTLGAALEIFARVQNAADEEYRELIGHHAPGRAGYAGVRVRF